MSDKYQSKVNMEVRDYECDIEGIVNNAIYLHYLEHARCQFLKKFGINFIDLTGKGINLVVAHADIEYKAPLKSGDRFVVVSSTERTSAFRFAFFQEIFKNSGQKKTLIARARISCAAVDRKGKPIVPAALEPMFKSSRIKNK